MKQYANKKTLSLFLALCLVLSLASSVLAYDGDQAPPPGHRGGPMPPPDRAAIEKQIGEKLQSLIGKGTIDAEQADKALNYWRKKENERQAEHEKLQAMSPEERHAYLEKHRKDHPDIIKELIKHLDLSKEQAQAVADALRPPAPPPGEHRCHCRPQGGE